MLYISMYSKNNDKSHFLKSNLCDISWCDLNTAIKMKEPDENNTDSLLDNS